MSLIIASADLAPFGGEEEFASLVADFTAALTAHPGSIGEPAPAAHPLVELVVRLHGGVYTIVEPDPEPEPEPEPEVLPTLEQARSAKLAALTLKRERVEVGGMLFNGAIPINTSPSSLAKIDGAITLFDKDPTLTIVEFEAQAGLWVDLNADMMTQLGIAVGRHVQSTFSQKRVLQAEIMALETIEDIDGFDIDARW